MLILTRKCGQSFYIGDDICVTITDVSGDKVRIGIAAPRALCVLREELAQTRDSNRLAMGAVSSGALRAVAATLLGGAVKKEKEPE